MAEVKARPGENIESLLRRFKKTVENAGILADYRKNEYYEKPSVKIKRKRAAAIKRARKAAKNRRPKVSKASWQWNKDRTKKITIKPRPQYNKNKQQTNPRGNPRVQQKQPFNRPYQTFNKKNYNKKAQK